MHTSSTTPETPPARWDAQQFANILARIKYHPILRGIAIGTEMVDRVRALEITMPRRPDALCGYGVPYIVDPRMKGRAEAYYDTEAWTARCREQNEFDARI
jgi:hypothetical protein